LRVQARLGQPQKRLDVRAVFSAKAAREMPWLTPRDRVRMMRFKASPPW
jgi:hypothetical protein